MVKQIVMREINKLIVAGCITALLMLDTNYIKGQQLNYIPPSPNAASLALPVDVAVSKYTGIPGISIPLYTINTGDLSLPITVDYHASGIKVEQEASWTGLGWSLSAGGCIARQIRGRDDFDGFGYGYISGSLPPNTPDNLPQWTYNPQIDNPYLQNYKDIAAGQLDGEPDQFYYNFGGKTGKLVFQKQSGNIFTATPLSQNSMKFLYNWNTQNWEVIDEKGIRYFLGTDETTTNSTCSDENSNTCYPDSSSSGKITAWYLDSIKSPSGYAIRFSYDTISHQTISQIQRSELLYRMTNLDLIYSSGDGYISPLLGNNNLYMASKQETEDVYLQEISFSGGKLLFKTSARSDMAHYRYYPSYPNEPQRLDTIKIYDENDIKLKSFAFSYSYFNQDNNTTEDMRLRLDSIRESSAGVSLPAYRFFYNNTSLPKKTSYSIDHWGFYNGKNNDQIPQYYYTNVANYLNPGSSAWEVNEIYGFNENGRITKAMLVPSLEYQNDTSIFFTGADREPDAGYTQAAILTKIQYPTGGSTEFEYEPNQYSSTDSLYRDNTIFTTASGDNVETSFQKDSITLEENSMVFFDYIFDEDEYYSGTPAYPDAVAVVKGSSGKNIIEFKPQSQNWETHIVICLPPGKYILYVDCPIDDHWIFQEIRATYNEKIKIENGTGGGLRVRKITNKDSNGATAFVETYAYEEESGVSTGRLISPLKYYYNERIINANYNILPGNAIQYIYQGDYVVRTSSSCIPFGNSAQGNPLGYSKVICYKGTGPSASNGKTIYYYRNTPEQQAEYFMPGVPNRVFNDNGLITRIEDYNSNGNLVTKKIFSYLKEVATDINIKGVKTYSYFEDINNSSSLIRFYDINSEWWRPVSDTVYSYSSDGSETYSKTINNYSFDNSSHKLLTGKTTEGSDGAEIRSKVSYPADIDTGIYSSMVSLNMLDYPIEQTSLRNGDVTGSALTTYKPGGGSYVPDKVYSVETTSSLSPSSFTYFNGSAKDDNYGLTPEMEFISYNAEGRLLKALGKNGLYTYYIWAYNNQYPVAKIESSKDTTLSVLVIDNNLSKSDVLADIQNDVNYLKGLLTYISKDDYRVTLYTYKPLVGMTSETGPDGRTVYYEYDNFGRLQYTRDSMGNTINKYRYHYANQQE